MQNDDNILPSIPPFLRRFEESPLRKIPVRPRDLPATRAQPAPQSEPADTPAPRASKVVDMTRQGTAERPAAQRARIALAFETRDRPGGTPGDVAAGAPTAAPAGADSEDVTFQVSLPRGVVRQLDMLAVEKDTTQRAVLLRALRLAGLSVPEGSIADPRVATRRSQA